MAWLKLESSARSSPKIARVARALGIPEAHARGLVCGLWCWVVEARPDGDLAGLDSVDLAYACGWGGDPEALMAALLGSGLIDSPPGCGLGVHGWAERMSSYRESQRRAERRHARGTGADNPRMSADNTGHGADNPRLSAGEETEEKEEINLRAENENQTNQGGSRKPENQTPSEPSIEPAQRLIESAKQLEQWGFAKYGQLTGTNWARLRSLLPADREELDAAAATGGNSWGYVAKVLISMRERASERAPQAPQRKAPKAKHPAIERALEHHKAGHCSLSPDAHDQREIIRRADSEGIDWALLEQANREPDCDTGHWETLWLVYDRLKNPPTRGTGQIRILNVAG